MSWPSSPPSYGTEAKYSEHLHIFSGLHGIEKRTIPVANKGNPAPREDRKRELAAMAEFA